MNQRIILALLELASKSSDPGLRNAVQCQLGDELHHRGKTWEDSCVIFAEALLDNLFVETARQHPSLLPHLFPVFAMLCGDGQSESYMADIDWSLVKTKDQKTPEA